ncbi:alpha/beta hydrolase-fold protein, partial [Porticoccaceae bacterium]|nr:alpha/beta hydrolase-fold protein [Porticoccaceae bacterium]
GTGEGHAWPKPVVIDCDLSCVARHPMGFDASTYPNSGGISIYNAVLVDLDGDEDLDILINLEVNPLYFDGSPFVSKRYAHAAYYQVAGSFDMSSAPIEIDMGFRLDGNTEELITDDGRVLDPTASHYWESELIDVTGDHDVDLVTLENNQFHVSNARFLISIYSWDAENRQYELAKNQPEDTGAGHDQNFRFDDLNGDSRLDIISTLNPGPLFEHAVSLHQNLSSNWSLSKKTFSHFMQENNCNRIYTPDFDSDGNLDVIITCPRFDSLEIYYGKNQLLPDRDHDSIPDEQDKFPLTPIGDLLDSDNDGAPNDCGQNCLELGMNDDGDDDGDGVADNLDAFPLNSAETLDTDSDSIGNNSDLDDDGDGVLDTDDAYPLISLNGLTDTDFDGLPNECDSDCLDTGMTADTDDDGDTISDADEATSGTNPLLADTDRDGFSDAQELIDATDPLDKEDCATCTPPVSGIVYHWNNHALLESVDVSLVGLTDGVENDFAEQGRSSASGQYAFTQKHRGTNHLTASKVITDGESGSVISSADALAALKIAVGINPNTDPDGSGPLEALPVSPYQYIAADINGDGRITSADALAILKMAVKLDSAEPRSWVFVAEDYEFWDEASKSFLTTRADITWNSSGMTFEYPEKSVQNVVGVLMGDVNGNWSAPEGSKALGESYLPELIKSQGGSLGQWGLVDTSVEDDAIEDAAKESDVEKLADDTGEIGTDDKDEVTADGKEYSQDLSSVEIVVNGTVRDYYVYVPSSSDTSPIPLLYLLNGGSAERTPFEQQSNFEAMADREGIVLVVPVSQKLPSNESAWQLNADNSSMQDIDYIEAIYTDVSSRTAIDANRVYAIGYSLGGMFSYELACQMSNRFAAIGSLAGSMPVAPTYCDPYRNVPILHVHGVQDEIIPYSSQWEWKAWDAVGTMRDTPSLIEFWSSRYNCSKQSKTSITATVDLDVREDCDSGARVEHYRLENGTHVWPTSIGDLETPEVFWSFLSSFSLESTSP